MTQIILSGATGAMGKIIIQMVKNDPNIKIVAGIGQSTDDQYDFPIFTSFDLCQISCDCIIDFSTAALVPKLIEYALKNKIPTVVCTTGLPESTESMIIEASSHIAIFKSGNMSLGINLINRLVKQAAAILDNSYDIEIIEKHHNRKLDSPSGTAVMLANAANEGLSQKRKIILGRTSNQHSKSRDDINIHSVRGGTIIGDHEVIFAGEDENIVIGHSASSRKVFAKGAIEAALYIQVIKPGLYNMDHLLSNLFTNIL